MTKPILRTFIDNATDNGLQQDSGVVAATSSGDFYAIWRDSGNFNSGHADIVGRHFDTSGNPVGGDVSLLPLNNAFGVPFNASQPATVRLPIAGQADGTATAFTDNFNNGPDFDVYVVRTDASLNRLGNPLLIDGSTSVTNDPSVTSFADGSLVVSYTIQNSSTDWDILARTVSAAGVVGPVITLFNDTDRSDLSDLATLANGNFVAVFESPFLGSPTDLDSFFTIKTENGTNVVSPTTVVGAGSTATETNPHVAALTGGGFVVTWTDSAGDENGTSQGIRASVYDANGNLVPNAGDILVNQFNQAGTQLSNDVTALPGGGFAVIWEDVAAGVDRVQRFDAVGHLIGTPITVSNLATFDVNAATLAGGSSVYTVNDFSSGNNNTDSSILLYPAPNDFNANTFSDVLWQNSSDGSLVTWLMNGPTVSTGTYVTNQGNAIAPDSTWSVAGIGDSNGDGRADLLWRQSTTGSLVEWQMNGSQIASSSFVTSLGNPVAPDSSWSVPGLGDFNGDGDADILWRQSTTGSLVDWSMNGPTIQTSSFLTFQGNAVAPDSSWSVVGIGDFNDDGKADLLWRQTTTGTMTEWQMNGSQVASSNFVTSQGNPIEPDSSWSVAGIGDFNGDGNADVLWRQSTTGSLVDWSMNGPAVQSGVYLTYQGNAVAPDSTWNVVEIGDFDGDGHADILWQQSTTGSLVEWNMNGSQVAFSNFVTSEGNPIAPPSNFQVQGKPTDFV